MLLGALPMLLLLIVLVGSIDHGLEMLALSVLCTFGIGGVFWLALAMLIGAILQLLLPSLRARPGTKPGRQFPGGTAVPAIRDERVQTLLLEYTFERLQRGSSEAGVRRDLLRSGWSEAQADTALEQARAGLTAHDDPGAGRAPDAR